MTILNQETSVIILAAGKGTRMLSALPKALHTIGGKSMILHVIDAVNQLNVNRVHLVYGHGGDLLRKHLFHQKSTLNWVFQSKQHGTGHAVYQTLSNLCDKEIVLVLYADIPLISYNTLQKLLISYPKGGISLLTVTLDNPDGYGRIVRNKGEVSCIVEQKDANEQQKYIKEVNTGILVVGGSDLKRWLNQLNNRNIQNEFYLTDIISMAYREGRKINTIQPLKRSEVEGVNNLLQLARLERLFQREQAESLLLAGIVLSDPDRFDMRGDLCHGKDIFIDTNVILEGRITLGNRVKIGSGCILKNAIIGDDVTISPYTVIEEAIVSSRSTLGPFARLRPGSELKEGAHVGNFVEMKQTCLGRESKAGHLSYLGNAEIGTNVNIGAGTITCNYDGINKHQTVICDNVFIGADSQLVAPVTIGKNSTIGAGTTVTDNVAEGETIISRIPQFSLPNWKRPKKK